MPEFLLIHATVSCWSPAHEGRPTAVCQNHMVIPYAKLSFWIARENEAAGAADAAAWVMSAVVDFQLR